MKKYTFPKYKHKKFTLFRIFYSSTFKIYNLSFKIYNSTLKIYNSSFKIYKKFQNLQNLMSGASKPFLFEKILLFFIYFARASN